MARPKVSNTSINQIPLIETEHPDAKRFRAARNAYFKHLDEKNAAAKKADQKREEILLIVKEMGIKPDADGVLKFRLGGDIIKIEPGKAKLKIEAENAVDEEDGDEIIEED